MKKPVAVKTDEESPAPEILAQAIVGISEGMKKLRSGPLKERALLVLIRDNYRSPVKYDTKKPSAGQIRAVMDSIESLRSRYVRS